MKTLTFGYPKLSIKSIALLGILSALQIVISRFTFGTSFLKIGFTFTIIILIAKWFGPIWGCFVGIINDYLGTLLIGGPIFIGFTVTAITVMVIYGIFFYNQEYISWKRAFLATFLVLLIANAFMNTIWISMLYHYTAPATLKLFEIRATKELIMLFIEAPIIYFITNNAQLEKMRQRAF